MEEKVFIDTNVILVGALHLQKDIKSPKSKILKLITRSEQVGARLRLVTSLKQIEEIHKAAKILGGKDFAGWLKYLLFVDWRPEIIRREEYLEAMKKFKKKVPEEDLVHFAVSYSKCDYLISQDREFLKDGSRIQKKVRCLAPKKFQAELKL